MEIEITIRQGGTMEFERTGIYHSCIKFYIKKYKNTWQLKLKSEEQKVVLKYKVM